MYLIFFIETGKLQFGFKPIQNLNINSGVLIDSYNQEDINIDKKQIIINNNFLNSWANVKDYRITIKNKISRKILFNTISALTIVFNLLFRNKNKIMLLLILLFIINILPIYCFSSNIETNIDDKDYKTNDFYIFFKKTKTADYISKNKFEYIDAEIPKINSISDYRIIPLNTINESEVNNMQLQIALPYKQIISIKKNKNSVVLLANYQCDNKKMFIFNINYDDDILILNKKYLTDYNYNYIIFHDNYMYKNICSDKEKDFLEK